MCWLVIGQDQPMSTDYKLRFFDKTGALKKEVADFLPLSYTRTVNAPGICTVALTGDHALWGIIEDKWQMDLMSKPAGEDWGRDFVGIYRAFHYEHMEQAFGKLVLPGLMDILNWRIVDFPANTADKSAFASEAAETIANTIVKYNCTSDATTANGRGRNGAAGYPFTGLTVEADGAAGNVLNFYCFGQKVLKALQNLAEIGGGDFDLVKTSATAWQWRWYTGQLGTDKTSSVVFSLKRGNMTNVKYADDQRGVATVAIVGGEGKDDARLMRRVASDDYAVDNDIEVFVQATDIAGEDAAAEAGLDDRGYQKLGEMMGKSAFDFDVVQTPKCRYGVEYDLGDLVTAINPRSGASVTMKIVSVTVALAEQGDENIGVKMEFVALVTLELN